MKYIVLLIPLVFVGCGTISSQDYTDLAIQNAVNEARIEAAMQAAAARDREKEQVREAIRLLLEQWASQDGRRPHRPGGA